MAGEMATVKVVLHLLHLHASSAGPSRPPPSAASFGTAAILASLTSTCRRHDADPQLYLTQLLVNPPTISFSELPAWLPDQWRLTHSAQAAL
jgi:hypothetical protein